jgi:hypothetical protein
VEVFKVVRVIRSRASSADTDAMQAHLGEISAAVDPSAHAILVLDQAGWHMST